VEGVCGEGGEGSQRGVGGGGGLGLPASRAESLVMRGVRHWSRREEMFSMREELLLGGRRGKRGVEDLSESVVTQLGLGV
jgi:hypothetical protein